MTDAIEVTNGMMDQIAKAIQDASATHGSQIVDVTLESARVLALQDIMSSAIVFVIFSVLLRMLYVAHRKTRTAPRSRFELDEFESNFLRGAGFVVCMIFFIISSVELANIRTWYGIFHPEVYIASGIVKKVIN